MKKRERFREGLTDSMNEYNERKSKSEKGEVEFYSMFQLNPRNLEKMKLKIENV